MRRLFLFLPTDRPKKVTAKRRGGVTRGFWAGGVYDGNFCNIFRYPFDVFDVGERSRRAEQPESGATRIRDSLATYPRTRIP